MSVIITEEREKTVLKKISFNWVSDLAGVAVGTTLYSYSGICKRLVTKPGIGVDKPSSYNVTITDEDGADILVGSGVTRSDTNLEQVIEKDLSCVVGDKLTVNISGAGATKKGTAHLYIGM